MIIAKIVIVMVVGYLLGSIPFGLLIGKRAAGVDVRQYGSGRTGSTNVLRTVGKKAAALAAALDVLKGVLAVVFAGLIFGKGFLMVGNFALDTKDTLVAQALAALAAVVGHIWPVFLKFRGGRGVATFMGGLLALYPLAGIISGGVLFLSAGLTRYASLGSIAGILAAYIVLIPLTIVNSFPVEYLVYALIGGLLIIYMHRDNVVRLLSGKERKLGERV